MNHEASDSGPSRPGAPPRCRLFLQNPNRYRELQPAALRPWLGRLVAELAPSADTFTVRFVGDRAMRALNRDFRGKDQSTDVLSFPGDHPATAPTANQVPATDADGDWPAEGWEDEEGCHLGDVVISLPYARRQAADLDHSLDEELRVLLLHGLLHCLGWDHEADHGEMDALEAELRPRWTAGWEVAA